MIPRALKHVRHERIEDHLRQGWMISFPNAAMHHHVYSAELKWICECRIPGARFDRNRTPNEEKSHERAEAVR